MYNKCIFVGNLTRDIELRYLPSGAAVAKCAIATSHKYKSQSGEQKDEVCFMDFDIFGRVAEVANQYLKKGSKVLLEGRIVFEQWTAQDGSTRSRHKLRVEVMKMLDGKKEGESYSTDDNNGGGYDQGGYDQGGYDNYNNQGQGNYNPSQGQGQQRQNPNQGQGQGYNPNQSQGQGQGQGYNPNQGQGQGQGQGYNPNQGQGQGQQRQNPNQGQGQGQQRQNPNQGQGHNPNQGQGHNPNQGQGHNPNQGQGYNPNQGQGYNPSQGHNQNQSYNPQSQSSFNGNNGRMPEIDIDEDEIPF